jgi:hypothetical protein
VGDPMTRVPPKVVDLLDATARTVRERILSALPAGVGDDTQAYVLQQVLGTALRDWLENGNVDGLMTQDVHDLHSFVSLAATIADLSHPDRTGLSLATFKTVLAALLEDWLENWNADGPSGPPASEQD